jgi:hypothetical protein
MWTMFFINAYLTYYTFRYARKLWKNDCKPGAAATFVLALSFMPLTFYIMLAK